MGTLTLLTGKQKFTTVREIFVESLILIFNFGKDRTKERWCKEEPASTKYYNSIVVVSRKCERNNSGGGGDGSFTNKAAARRIEGARRNSNRERREILQ